MNTHVITRPRWSTASIAGAADTTPMELSALGEHFDHCKGCQGRLFTLQCMVDKMHGVIAPRLVTTLVIVTGFFAVASLVS